MMFAQQRPKSVHASALSNQNLTRNSWMFYGQPMNDPRIRKADRENSDQADKMRTILSLPLEHVS